ncbi:unnamed protein product, partial [marine sediment metagenome]
KYFFLTGGSTLAHYYLKHRYSEVDDAGNAVVEITHDKNWFYAGWTYGKNRI